VKDAPERARHSVWQPFTQMSDWMDGNPVVIERGEGNYLIDTEGRRYLDGIASMWVNLHGHSHETLRRRLHEQIDQLPHSTLLGVSNVRAIELAEQLVAIAPPGLTRVFYSDNGSTAVEVALKLAFQYWQLRGEPERRVFVSLEDAYHGDTLGAVSVGGIASFHSLFQPLMAPQLRARNAPCYRCPYGLALPACDIHCLESLEGVLREHGPRIAAVIVEPLMQAAAGMLRLPDGWLRRVRALCDAAGTLLIADEVATGFGRTGRMFACEHEGVTPDLLAIAKSLTGGYLPLGATLATEAVFAAFLGPAAEKRHFFHGHSYSGNPLGCAAALANLEVFAAENVLERVAARSEQLARRLAGLRGSRWVGDVRQIGLMAGVELVADRERRTRFPAEDRVGHFVCLAARRHGVLLRPLGDVIVVLPPLSISAAELDQLVSAVAAAIDDVLGA
jgi:adenosylmethionine---8-amino-7-oxononanoate aminotransferase